MLKIHMIIIYSSIIICLSCGNSEKSSKDQLTQKEYKYAKNRDGILHLDLNEARKHPRVVKLSEICDSLIYIPLETKKECLISRSFHKIAKDGDYIFIHYGWGLYLFNSKGKFICQIGKIGRGPGEYVCSDFCISRKDKRIYAIANFKHRILEFDYSGRLLSNHKRIYDFPCSFDYDELNNVFISTHDYEMSSRKPLDSIRYNVFKIRDLDGKILHARKSGMFPKEDIHTSTMSLVLKGANLYKYKTSCLIQELSSDTIYKINNYKLEPQYVLNNKLFKDNMNYKNYMNVVKNRKNNSYATNLFYNRIIGETERYILLGNSEHYIYDKKENKLEMFINETDIHGGFHNDIDNVIKCYPQFVLNDKYLVFTVAASNLLETVTINANNNSESDNIYTRKVNDICKFLSESDNPVLILARLKN